MDIFDLDWGNSTGETYRWKTRIDFPRYASRERSTPPKRWKEDRIRIRLDVNQRH